MNKYVNVEDVKDLINGLDSLPWEDEVDEMVDKLVAADVVEVNHGYWKDIEYGTCSVCDRSISEIYDADSSMSYGILDELMACPFCGAKMDLKEGVEK